MYTVVSHIYIYIVLSHIYIYIYIYNIHISAMTSLTVQRKALRALRAPQLDAAVKAALPRAEVAEVEEVLRRRWDGL